MNPCHLRACLRRGVADSIRNGQESQDFMTCDHDSGPSIQGFEYKHI